MYNVLIKHKKKYDDYFLFIIYSKECLFSVLNFSFSDLLLNLLNKKLQMTIVCFTHCLEI